MEKTFLENLASEKPTPGGGTASALAGSMGAALVAMVAKLSTKEAGDAFQISEKAEGLMTACYDLAREDSQAFDLVMSAYRLPRKTEEEKAHRAEQIEASLKKASEVPFRSARTSLDILRLAETFLEKANANALSDIGVAALLAHAAMEGAALNVLINLGSLKDKPFVARLLVDLEQVTGEGEKRVNAILKAVYDQLWKPLKQEL